MHGPPGPLGDSGPGTFSERMTDTQIPDGAILLRESQVCELVQVAPRTLSMMISARRFPRPVRLGPGTKARKRWHRDEIEKWLRRRLDERED